MKIHSAGQTCRAKLLFYFSNAATSYGHHNPSKKTVSRPGRECALLSLSLLYANTSQFKSVPAENLSLASNLYITRICSKLSTTLALHRKDMIYRFVWVKTQEAHDLHDDAGVT
jgi:hypothetical protein